MRRWLLVVLALLLAAFVVDRSMMVYRVFARNTETPGESAPGEDAFREANRLITRFKEQRKAYGNTPDAETLAARFSTAITEERNEGFTKGKRSAYSLSGHQFLTYCRLNSDSCVFLVHVPGLRRFNQEARLALGEIAWTIAHELASEAGLPRQSRLAVGVKGLANYDTILIGDLSHPDAPLEDIEQQERGFDLTKVRLLHPFFATASSAPEPRAADTLPLVAPASPAQASPYADYRGLLGEDFRGNVFVIELHQRRWAVMSRHQFDHDAIPTKAEDILKERTIALQASAVVRQRDVQLVPVADQSLPLLYLAFDPVFEVEAGEKLWIERGGKNGTTGTLLAQGLRHRRYSALDRPQSLAMRLDTPADVRGASGSPVIRLKTGLPIGVLLSADDGLAARTIAFESISVVEKIPGPALDDTRIAAMIPGVWIEDFTRFGNKVIDPLRFYPDGRYDSTLNGAKNPAGEPVMFSGRWKIENARLVYHDLRCNSPEYPLTPITDAIVAVGQDYLVYEGPERTLFLMRKISESSALTP